MDVWGFLTDSPCRYGVRGDAADAIVEELPCIGDIVFCQLAGGADEICVAQSFSTVGEGRKRMLPASSKRRLLQAFLSIALQDIDGQQSAGQWSNGKVEACLNTDTGRARTVHRDRS